MSSVNFDVLLGGDGTTVSDDTNPTTGLRNGGYLTRFVPALVQFVAMLGFAKTQTQNATTQATNAANSAADAQAQRNLAESAKTSAVAAQSAAETARNLAQGYAGLAMATNPLEALQVNKSVITADQTLAAGYNALSAGPIEIADGVTVTIEETSTWSIA